VAHNPTSPSAKLNSSKAIGVEQTNKRRQDTTLAPPCSDWNVSARQRILGGKTKEQRFFWWLARENT
jgi:hypothetical protein